MKRKKNKYMDKNKNNEHVEAPESVVDGEISINDIDNEFLDQENTEAAKDLANEEMQRADDLQQQLDDTKAQLEKEKKEYLFLMAEFDNFRKRTLKEKSELIKNGGESALRGLLPVIDDFERSLAAINSSEDASAIKEGVELIYNKFVKYLEQNGVKPIDSAAGADFDTELHEAITAIPAPDESQKGKVIDTVQKGYTLHDKVLRHAKVVVGQ